MKTRVMAVDDNRANLDLILYLLNSFGYDAKGFASSPAALEELAGGAYELALVDILMPEMDGFEFARRARSDDRTKHIPLIAITALAMVGDRERIIAAGFDGYIPKPIDPEHFLPQVQQFYRNAKRAHARTAAPRGPIVLVVDDLLVNRQVIRGVLVPSGYRLVEASNGTDALELIRASRPDLILCDVHMPGGGGFAFVEQVKGDDRLRDIPFIFISSTAWQTRDKRRALELGADKFILRPIDPQRLLDEVRAAVGGGNGTDSGS